MKLKNFFFLIAFLLSSPSLFAQYAEDALRFSQTEPGTTARFRAMGNVQTAIGGDLSSLAINPAGLGLFTGSEIGLTADFTNTNLNSQYLGQPTSAGINKLGLTQAGGVWHNSIRKPQGSDLNKGLLNFNFGISYNRTNNFNATTDYQGVNPNSSFADYLSDISFGAPANLSGLQGMAYDNYLISYDGVSAYYPTTNLNNEFGQRNTVYRTGSTSEVNFGFGANVGNTFFFGASLGLTSVNYTADRQFIETGDIRSDVGLPDDYSGAAYNLAYRSYQNTTGSGVNLKLGFIYRPANSIRIGISYVSPSWYSISDSYSEGLNTHYTQVNGSAFSNINDDVIYDFNYNLSTASHVNGGLAIFLGNRGLISGDVEYVDYSSIKFKSPDDREAEQNTTSDIRNNYTSAVNFKVGGELKVTDNLSLRAGFNSKGNPYKDANYSNSSVSAGLGYRVNNFYIDAAYVNSTTKYSERPYAISETYPDFDVTGSGEIADIKNNRSGVLLTIGTRF